MDELVTPVVIDIVDELVKVDMDEHVVIEDVAFENRLGNGFVVAYLEDVDRSNDD